MSESRTALVTGASRGIGAAIADRLIADGMFVFGTATSKDGADAIDVRLQDHGAGLELQLHEEASVNAALETLGDSGRSVDVLVNNAGITDDNLMVRMSDDAWSSVIDANLNGLFRVTKPLVRSMMRQRWGRIVNLGSVVGRSGNPGQVNYSTAKAGIEGFTRSLALELGARGITVNCVAPGFIETDMTASLSESIVADLLAKIPLGRMGVASDVANVVSFLASDEASYLTAQTIHVNGGMLPT